MTTQYKPGTPISGPKNPNTWPGSFRKWCRTSSIPMTWTGKMVSPSAGHGSLSFASWRHESRRLQRQGVHFHYSFLCLWSLQGSPPPKLPLFRAFLGSYPLQGLSVTLLLLSPFTLVTLSLNLLPFPTIPIGHHFPSPFYLASLPNITNPHLHLDSLLSWRWKWYVPSKQW